MASTVVELSGDEVKLLKALQKVIDAEAKHAAALGDTAKAAGRAGDAVRDGMQDAAEGTEKSMQKILADLRRAGPEGREVAKELQASWREQGKAGEQSIDQIIGRLDDLDPAAAAAARDMKATLGRGAAEAADDVEANLGDGTDRTGRRFESFSRSAVGQVTAIAGAYASVDRAIGSVIELNNQVLATNREIFAELKQQEGGNRRLLQVATDADDFDDLRDTADRLSTEYGIDRGEARNLVFSARSEGFEDQLDFIAANQQQIDVAAQAGVAGQIPTLFRDENLSGDQAINATLAAAQSSRLDFETVAAVLPVASEGAALTNSTAAETLGAVAATASDFGSASTAGDRLKALATKFASDKDYGLSGIGLTAAVEKLQGLDSADRDDFLGGSSELKTAFAVFTKELDRIKEFTANVSGAIESTGTENSPTAIGRRIAGSDDQLSAVRAAAQAENRKVVERERNRSAGEGQRQASVDNALADAERSGASGFEVALAEKAAGFAEYFGGDGETAVQRVGAAGDLTKLTQALGRFDQAETSIVRAVVDQIRIERRDDSDAILTASQTESLLRQTGRGDEFNADDVATRTLATNILIDAAGRVPQSGLERNTFLGNAENRAAVETLFGNLAALAERTLAANERQAAAAEATAAAAEKTATATDKTAANTTPPPRPLVPGDPAADTRRRAADADAGVL